MPTGSGKTRTSVESSISFLLENKAKIGRILWLADRDELVNKPSNHSIKYSSIEHLNRFKYGDIGRVILLISPLRMEADMSLVWSYLLHNNFVTA